MKLRDIMAERNSDRNLLAGVLGLQLELFDTKQLIEAMKSWVFQKTKALEEVLLEQGGLDASRCEFLKHLVEEHMRLHGGSAHQAAAALSSHRVLHRVMEGSAIGDEELEQSMAGMVRSATVAEEGPLSATASLSMRATGSRFQILRPYAQGGLGQISVAEDLELHREVALKEIQPRHANQQESRIRFLIEAEVTGRLEHPGIVPVYSLGTSPSGNPYYAMRFIRGESLKDAVAEYHRQKGVWDEAKRKQILRGLLDRFVDVCNAVEYAHSRGVIHRDLKPANIMLGKYGETLVVDWGLARTGSKRSEEQWDEATCIPYSGDQSTQTRMGTMVGTPHYMSPEQAAGQLNEIGPVSDVFGLGATLFTILTGKTHSEGKTPEEVMKVLRSGPIRRVTACDPKVPRALDAICAKAMSLRQGDRYPSSASLRDDIERWLGDEPTKAYPEPWHDRLARLLRRHRSLVLLTAGVLVTAIIALGVINAMARKQNQLLAIARDAATMERDKAIDEKERAEQNLAAARQLAWAILDTAERKLTATPFDGKSQFALRKELTEKALTSFRAIRESNPEDGEAKLLLAKTARISANLKRFEGDLESARQDLDLAFSLQLDKLEDQRNQQDRDLLANTYRDAFTLLKAMGKFDEARQAFEKGYALVEAGLKEQPEDWVRREDAGNFQIEMTTFLSDQLDPESLTYNRKAVETFRELYDQQPTPMHATLYMLAAARRIKIALDLVRLEGVGEWTKQAMEVGEKLRGDYPDDVNVKIGMARCSYWSAEAMADAGEVNATTVGWADEGYRLMKELVELQPVSPYMYSLGEALRVQAKLLRLQGRHEEAKVKMVESKERFEGLLAKSSTALHHEGLGKCLYEMALEAEATSELETMRELLREAIKSERKALELSPSNRLTERLLKSFEGRLVE